VGVSSLSRTNQAYFIVNTTLHIAFNILIIVLAPSFWPFYIYLFLEIVTIFLSFRKERTESKEMSSRKRGDASLFREDKSMYQYGQLIPLSLYFVIVWADSFFLFVGFVFFMFSAVDTFADLGRFLAQIATRNHTNSEDS